MVFPKPGGAREFTFLLFVKFVHVLLIFIGVHDLTAKIFELQILSCINMLHSYHGPSRLWFDKWQPANARYVEEGWKWVRYDDVMMT